MPQPPILILQLLDPKILIPGLIPEPRLLHIELVHDLAMKQLEFPMERLLQDPCQLVMIGVDIAAGLWRRAATGLKPVWIGGEVVVVVVV